MTNPENKNTGVLYVWQSKSGKWYRTGVSPNGETSVPSQAYEDKDTAEDLTPVKNFCRNPKVVFGRPPRKKAKARTTTGEPT